MEKEPVPAGSGWAGKTIALSVLIAAALPDGLFDQPVRIGSDRPATVRASLPLSAAFSTPVNREAYLVKI